MISNALLSNKCTQIYKIVKLLKKPIKIIKAAPTCCASRRNYHQGCSSLMMVSAWTETCWRGFCKFNWFLTIQRFYIFECINWTIKHLILLRNSVLFRRTSEPLLLHHFNTHISYTSTPRIRFKSTQTAWPPLSTHAFRIWTEHA